MIPARYLIIIAFILGLFTLKGQDKPAISQNNGITYPDSLSGMNRLTVYVIPSKVKYDWSSPHTLYKSFIKNYTKNLFSKKNYVLGHAFVDLHPVEPDGRIFTGMRSVSKKEQKELIYKKHYGLSILGCDMAGRLESQEELAEKIEYFAGRGQLGYIAFLISDAAADRLADFFREYKLSHDCDTCPEIRYGGAFYPRYHGEGAGCSAFVISFMEIAGLLADEFSNWLISIDIPMSLIGGPYNNEQEVKLKDIRKEKTWADTGKEKYEHLEMFDPTLMYEWISDKYHTGTIGDSLKVTPVALDKAKGIIVDCRQQPLPTEQELFKDRQNPSIFIDYYHNSSRYRQQKSP